MRIIATILLSVVAIACNAQVQILGIIKTADAFADAVIVCDGNSLTYGHQASNPATHSYPARLQLSVPFSTNGGVVTNKGVNGQETQEMIDDYNTDIAPLYNASVKSILIAWEVGNDLYYNGDATAAYNRIVEYCELGRATGYKVIVVTVPYRDHSDCCAGVTPAGDNDAAYTAKRLSVNASIVANWEDFADGLADIAANSNLSSYNVTYFSADRIHLTDVGYQLVADLILPVILTL